MADMAETMLPQDLWELIASYLDEDDLIQFKLVTKFLNKVGSAALLQSLYNRLYAMDKSLQPLLPQDGAELVFMDAIEKIWVQQDEDMAYLAEHHPSVVVKYTLPTAQSHSPKKLKERHVTLETINIDIITSWIDCRNRYFDETSLSLEYANITLFPTALFQMERYVEFWQKLSNLNFSDNRLRMLDVRALPALKILNCMNNAIHTLDVPPTLEKLICPNNKITHLNITGFKSLVELICWGNQLSSLNLDDCENLQKLLCARNLLTALDVQKLKKLKDLRCEQNQIVILDLQGLEFLKSVACEDNQISELYLQGCLKLDFIFCSNNKITRLNARGLTALKTLLCSDNPIVQFFIDGCMNLKIMGIAKDQSLCLSPEGLIMFKAFLDEQNLKFFKQAKEQALSVEEDYPAMDLDETEEATEKPNANYLPGYDDSAIREETQPKRKREPDNEGPTKKHQKLG